MQCMIDKIGYKVMKLLVFFADRLICLILTTRTASWHNSWDNPKLDRSPKIGIVPPHNKVFNVIVVA